MIYKTLSASSSFRINSFDLNTEAFPGNILDEIIESSKKALPNARQSFYEVFDLCKAKAARSTFARLIKEVKHIHIINCQNNVAGLAILLPGISPSLTAPFEQNPTVSQKYTELALRIFIFPQFRSQGCSHFLIRSILKKCSEIPKCRLHILIRYDNWKSRTLFETYKYLTENKDALVPLELLSSVYYVFTKFSINHNLKPQINLVRIESFFRTLQQYSYNYQHKLLKETNYDLMKKFKSKSWIKYGWKENELARLSKLMNIPTHKLFINV